MGPREFGLATLVIATASVLIIPLLLGFHGTVVKFAAMEQSEGGQTAVISTNFWLHIGWGAFCAVVLYLLHSPLSTWLRLEPSIYRWSLVYAVLLSAFTFLTASLQGLMRFSFRGYVEFAYGFVTLLLLLLGLILGKPTFRVFIGSMDIALILASVGCFYYLGDRLRFIVTRKATGDVLSFTLPLFIAGWAGAVMQSASPLILASDLSAREVGYFGAYTMGSLNVAMVIFQLVNAVLAPLASDPSRHAGAWKKFFILILPMTGVSFIVLSASTVVMLKLVGKSYPIEPAWIAWFSAVGVTYLLFFCAMVLLGVRSATSAWLGTIGTLIMGACCLLGNLWAIKAFGFPGSAIGLVIGYGAGFLWCAYWGWQDIWRRSTS